MSKHIACTAILLALGCLPLHALELRAGAVGGAGAGFAAGSLITNRETVLSELAATSVSGQSEVGLTWSAGAYLELEFSRPFGLRFELSYLSHQNATLVSDSSGAPIDRIGVSYTAIYLPILARGRLPFGPGALVGSLGPYAGMSMGTTLYDQYASTSTTASFQPYQLYFGGEAGVGYEFPAGPGIASVEARGLLPFTSALLGGPAASGNYYPQGVYLMISYGFTLGGRR